MKSSRLLAGPLAALSLTGCLASKGDIRLLQDELRATRAAAARSDSVHRRESDSLLAAVAASQARTDSTLLQTRRQLQQSLQVTDNKVSDLATRVRNDELTTNDKIKSINDDLSQVQELARQNVRGVTAAKAAAERVQATAPVAAPAGDTSAVPSGPPQPGSATLLQEGNGAILQGSCRTARRSYEELLRLYPSSLEAPEAQYKIAESFVSCLDGGNPAAADSVYTLVTAKYPKSDWAATSLYKQSQMQTKANKPDSAKVLLQRIVCEYPKSTVFDIAKERLGGAPRCK